jgi:hypothetical protein
MNLTLNSTLFSFLLLVAASCGAEQCVCNTSCQPPVTKPTSAPIKKPKTRIEYSNIYCGNSTNTCSTAANGPSQATDTTKKAPSILDWIQMVAVIVGGLWALLIYRKNSQTKTIDTLILLEQEYRNHLPFLLEIEMFYDTHIKPVLERERSDKILESDTKVLEKLDGVLRHFYVCLQTRNLHVTSKDVTEKMYKFYLNMLTDGENHRELACYVNRYWPSITQWSKEL